MSSFWGTAHIICSAELVVVSDPQVRLACTDYRRIFISGDVYSALPEEKRLAVLAHEVLHIALRHAFRIGNRNKNRFEKAADIEVTFVLTESFPDPYGIKAKEEWRDLTAEQIYDLLPTREDKTEAKSEHYSQKDDKRGGRGEEDKQASDDDNGKTDGRTAEQNDKKDKSSDQDSKSKNTPSEGKSSKRKSASPSVSNDNQSNADVCSGDGDGSGNGDDGRGASSDNEDGSSGDGNQDVLSEFHPQFDAETEMNCVSLSSGTMMDMRRFGAGLREGIGTSFAAFERILNKLSPPCMNWQILLRQFLRLCRGGSYSWMHPNRKFISRGLYLPGRQGKSFSGIVALDTSGSTTDAMPQFVAELTGLLNAFGIFDLTVIECDEVIRQVWTVSSRDPIPDLGKHSFKGGGGTNFIPVFEYIRNHRLVPNALIFFTDGYGTCPETKPLYPVIWILTKDGTAPVPWGQVIYYEEN